MRLLTRMAATVGVLLMTSACGGAEPESPLDEGQAAEQADQHIREAVESLPGSVELELVQPTVSAACESDPLITVTQWYFLRGVPAEQNEEVIDALIEYWGANGFTLGEDLRPEDVFVNAQNDDDGFGMSVRSSVQGDLSINASSPCIHPDGSGE